MVKTARRRVDRPADGEFRIRKMEHFNNGTSGSEGHFLGGAGTGNGRDDGGA
jgi:hypothetical protein